MSFQIECIIDALVSIQACSLQFDAWREDITFVPEALAGVMSRFLVELCFTNPLPCL